MAMNLAFSARQVLDLMTLGPSESLGAYLKQEQRVVQVLLGSGALESLGPSNYRYALPQLKIFQLQMQPIVDLRTMVLSQRLVIRSCGCRLQGMALAVHDFQLQLDSWLEVRGEQLTGEASLAVQVRRPELLRLIPRSVLEGSGCRVLAGVLDNIKARVNRNLVQDFQVWCCPNGVVSPPPSSLLSTPSPES